MPIPFLEQVERSVVICDGAMGTQLYARGVFLNRAFDELNLTNPALVSEIHQEYVAAGAEILETNTFGANRVKLEPHGLADRVREINRAGVRIAREAAGDSAYVGGSVGPLGIRIEPYGKMAVDDARALFVEQIEALVEAGVDLICLETFSDLNEIHAALLAARDVTRLPVMAQMSLGDDGNSLEGTPPEAFGADLDRWGADIVGMNCGVGPQMMLESIERLAGTISARLVAQPNAGKPRSFEGRNLYLSSPEYLASYAKRFVRAGVRVVGGCCGTTPAHIGAMAAAVRSLTQPPSKVVPVLRVEPPVEEPVAASRRSRLAQKLEERRPVVLVDVVPPRGGDPSGALSGLRRLVGHGIDAVKVSEAPRAGAPMGALALAVLVDSQLGIESVLHYASRERTLLAMQSELLGAHALGIRNLLLTTGEPVRIGDYIDATRVAEVDSIGLTRLVAALNGGHDLGGNSIGRPTGFLPGVFVDPGALDLEEEIRRLDYKVEAGALFAFTQALFRLDQLEELLNRTGHCRIPVIAGIWPLMTLQDAEFLNNEIPGISIPDGVVERLQSAGSPAAERKAGIAIARDLVERLRGMVQGIVVRAHGEDHDTTLEILA